MAKAAPRKGILFPADFYMRLKEEAYKTYRSPAKYLQRLCEQEWSKHDEQQIRQPESGSQA